MDVATNLRIIQNNIRQACEKSNRIPDEITVIGVTKYVTIERTKEAITTGIKNLGENRLEGFLEKYNHIGSEVKWHFIGTLQSRKVKDVIDKVDAIHSLDRLSLAKEIDKRASKKIDCFIQVNVSGEESKHGLQPEGVISFIKDIQKYKHIRVVGLMTMAPHLEDKERLRGIFKRLAAIRDAVKLENLSNAPCEFLSMGMSNDYEIAIEEGATHIRIGSNLVG
ncbi:YggS family pyridoxal phosphate-dependent enzyme [Virgibacillus sp. NKC19-16]|uniref:YggS family pyridoxal phosphate-dependent enzyme n=1 Tax=Virgibacillus salidurans TaxID=2831673 RepID=UPI001F2EB5F1|nr:YggS family pyridoxal phosphate-dependent enzyme [Virgibacillus sp. NKC19-16]UJL47861.1 YggS family pyridoxal phosphate-dependent enzyme [Virgibacillus sp. NKC19-16]